MTNIKSGTQVNVMNTNRDVYIIYSATGEWEDYHENIQYLTFDKHYAELKLKELRDEEQRFSQEYTLVCQQRESFEDDDLGDLWMSKVKDLYFEDFLNEPEQYPDVLSRFTTRQQKRLLEYSQVNQRWEQLGGYLYEDVRYYMRHYTLDYDGKMTYVLDME